MRRILSLLSIALLPGCATIMEGTAQSVSVSTIPPGASCAVSREGTPLGSVNPTPGILRIDKSKNDLVVTCAKTGFQEATRSISPRFLATTFGNLIVGGLAGVIIDASTGANYLYPSEVRLELAPTVAGAPILAGPRISELQVRVTPGG